MSQASISDIPTTSTADQEVLVKVEGVSKKFCRSLKKSLWYGVCDIVGEVNPLTKHGARGTECGKGSAEGGSNQLVTSYASPATSDGLRPGEFWAVNDVSFELRRGECLGLIGHNGAGKTTLLKMLNGLLKPDSGRIEMSGRVGALIALGAGFNPILTGRENIYINGSVLGLSKKEIDLKIEEIVDFAELGEFIDMPVQNYSSGMTVRLGFAIATTLDPDILILDEVLAVGDASFRAKCYERIGRIQRTAAVIFVSHSMDQISQVCSKVLTLKKGIGFLFADPRHGIEYYNNQSEIRRTTQESMRHQSDVIKSFSCSLAPRNAAYGESVSLQMTLCSEEDVAQTCIRIIVYDTYNRPICELNSLNSDKVVSLCKGPNELLLEIGPMHLKKGQYFIGIWIQRMGSIDPLLWSLRELDMTIEGPIVGKGPYILPLRISCGAVCGGNRP
jgi:lipopolysaccharide transport system ATP-binding protein